MTTLAGLEGKLERLKSHIAPRVLVLTVEAGQDVPASLLATLRPCDQVIIEGIPPGYFGSLEGKKEP